ncbi:tetratricopeptide repeat protein [Flavobacterium sp. CAU 1735]|uniref:tetratricopeptide repeat protein n=1 Tax=Flavobacterium sp. CAU 1735 TaxID=3140361 RepID=UPI003260040B
MKIKYALLATSMLFSAASFAQKDELKTLKKLYAKDVLSTSDISEYKSAANKLSGMSGLAESDLVYANFYKAMTPLLELMTASAASGGAPNMQALVKAFTPAKINEMATSLNATLDFEKKNGKKVYTDDINETITEYKPVLINYAITLNQASKFKEAGQVFEAIYNLDKKDEGNLYNASILALQAQDFDLALKYLYELKNINYSGEGTMYYAVNKASGNEESFNSDADRKASIKLGLHEKPRDEKVPSKRGEIYKNIASILVHQGKIDEAKKAISEAKAANPGDTSLMLAEANLYLDAKDFTNYKRIITEVLEKDPNDADLLFNLGVISTNSGDIEDAKKYYKRAIEVNPNYFNAYNNLGALMLFGEDKMVKEMNSLGTTPKDNKRFDELKAKRNKMYTDALPYFEKALQIEPKEPNIKAVLLNAYQVLEMDAKYKALKAQK